MGLSPLVGAPDRIEPGTVLASFWVVVSVGFYFLTLQAAVPGFGSPRAVAVLLLVGGSFACSAGADTDAFGSTTALAVLAAGTAVMWLATTTRHLLRAAAREPAAAGPEHARVPTGARD